MLAATIGTSNRLDTGVWPVSIVEGSCKITTVVSTGTVMLQPAVTGFSTSASVENSSREYDVSGYIEPTKWTYNTGTPMEASAYLYQATGDERWLIKARELAEASLQHFAPVADNQGVRHFPLTPWFNAVLPRGFCTLYDADPESDRHYIDALPASLLQAWPACRNDLGLMDPDWSGMMSSESPLDVLEQAATVEIASVAGL